MASKSLFKSLVGLLAPKADVQNGGLIGEGLTPLMHRMFHSKC